MQKTLVQILYSFEIQPQCLVLVCFNVAIDHIIDHIMHCSYLSSPVIIDVVYFSKNAISDLKALAIFKE